MTFSEPYLITNTVIKPNIPMTFLEPQLLSNTAIKPKLPMTFTEPQLITKYRNKTKHTNDILSTLTNTK